MNEPVMWAWPGWLLPDPIGVMNALQSARIVRKAFHDNAKHSGEEGLPEGVTLEDNHRP